MMDAKTKITGKPAEAFREIADQGTTQAKQAFEKTSAAAVEATDLIRNTYSMASKGAQDYNAKVLEFARTNTMAAFDFATRLSGVKSPTEFLEFSAEHARQQFATLGEQAKELAALAQKVALQTSEPVKAGMSKAFSHAV